MLKLDGDEPGISISTPAAFRRLCVETITTLAPSKAPPTSRL